MLAIEHINVLHKIEPLLDTERKIRLEIHTSVLMRLFAQRQLCASEFRCLDCLSKKEVRDLCLKTCLSCIQPQD